MGFSKGGNLAVNVVLADDHVMVRQGMRAILESEGNIRVIGEASNGLEAVNQIEKLKPDVALVDLMMPELGGLEVARQEAKQTHILIVSMHANEAYVLEALRNGAYGYVLKESTAQELKDAVLRVANGLRYLSPSLSERAIDIYAQSGHDSDYDPYDSLTTREREVFQLVAEGLSNGEISNRLKISPRTVEIHKSNVMHKLNLYTHTNIVRYALRKGILAMDD
jgi:two-component system, NarL family, response regulator NreC